MTRLLLWVGRIAGVAGALLSATAVALRLGGYYRIGGLDVGTILQGGTGAMVLACLCYTSILAERCGRRHA